jgi:hypothetical protein
MGPIVTSAAEWVLLGCTAVLDQEAQMRALGVAAAIVSVVGGGLIAQRQNAGPISAGLVPSQEVPVVLSPGAQGTFTAVINGDSIDYELTFSGLQAEARQAHIHVAQPGVNGGIVVWLCQTVAPTPTPSPDLGNPATQLCPLNGGTIAGTIVPSDVRAVASQGLATTLLPAERFERLVDAIRNGQAYANVHSLQSPGGEIRGQISVGAGHK